MVGMVEMVDMVEMVEMVAMVDMVEMVDMVCNNNKVRRIENRRNIDQNRCKIDAGKSDANMMHK